MNAPLDTSFGLGEWVFFLLANAIIIWICAPRLFTDMRRWIRRGGVATEKFEEGKGGS